MSILQSSVYISFRASAFLGDRNPSEVSQKEINALVVEKLTQDKLAARLSKPLSHVALCALEQHKAEQDFPVISDYTEDDRRPLSDLLGKGGDADIVLSIVGVSGVLPLTIALSRANGIYYTDTSDLVVIASRHFVSPVGSAFLHNPAFTDFVERNNAFVIIDGDAAPIAITRQELSIVGASPDVCEQVIVDGVILSEESRKEAYAKTIDDAFFTRVLTAMRQHLDRQHALLNTLVHFSA